MNSELKAENDKLKAKLRDYEVERTAIRLGLQAKPDETTDAAIRRVLKSYERSDSYIPQPIAMEIRKFLLEALYPGMGDTPDGVPNTTWALAKMAGERIKLLREVETQEATWDGDQELPEDDAIAAVFPTHSDRHDLYGEAMRLVGAKHSKRALVALVNWLLHRIDAAEKHC